MRGSVGHSQTCTNRGNCASLSTLIKCMAKNYFAQFSPGCPNHIKSLIIDSDPKIFFDGLIEVKIRHNRELIRFNGMLIEQILYMYWQKIQLLVAEFPSACYIGETTLN